MRFDTYLPCALLRPYVRAIALTESAVETTNRVLPDTGLVAGFQYKGRLARVEQEKAIPLTWSGVTGLHDGYQMFRSAAETGSVLVYFRETGARAFFSDPLQAFFRESVALDQLIRRPELSRLETQLGEASTDRDRIAAVERFLIARLQPVRPDEAVAAALSILHRTQGHMRIKDLAARVYLSQSPLEKRFRQVVGTSPKKLASILRMQHAIRNYPRHASLTDLSYAAGFYDPAHFTKAFKAFSGETPDRFFHEFGRPELGTDT